MTMFGSQWLANAGSGYEIDQSIRFNDDDSAHLSRTLGTATNRKIWTYSLWIKRANLGTRQMFWSVAAGGGAQGIFEFDQGDGGNGGMDKLICNNETSGTTALNWELEIAFRDPAAWYNFVFVYDTTQSTTNDRFKCFVNGALQTEWDRNSTPGQNEEQAFNNALDHRIGEGHTAANYFDGYMAEIHFIDGTAKAASDFGEYNDDGVWIPKAYSGSYGNNGFYLKGQDSSALGDDTSGNGNDFASSGLAAADQKSDTPTTNASTFNPLWAGAALSDGNLVATASADAYQWAISTFSIDDGGKYVCEFQKSAGTFGYVGIFQLGNHNATTGNNYMYGIQLSSGEIVKNSSVVASSGTVGVTPANSLMRIEYDGSNDTIKIFDDGAEIFPASTGVSNTVGLTGHNSLHFGCAPYASGTIITATFQGLSGTPTATFKELTSANLATPTITDGSEYFHTQLYTGNGSSGLAITNDANAGDFQPDLWWLAPRSNGDNHVFIDVARGEDKRIKSNGADAQDTDSPAKVTFETDGFDLDTTDSNFNGSSRTYVAWQWKTQGSAGSSNTDGSINTITTSVNQTAGISINTYTGTGSNATVGHGLGAVPKMIIIKDTTNAESWIVYHEAVGNDGNLYLNLTNAKATQAVFQNTTPTSSVFSLGTVDGANKASAVHVAYCFAEVPGYSSIGSYTGNGSTDGPFVYTGFRPAWLLVKRAVGGTGNWDIFDNKRDPFNVVDAVLDADNNTAETTYSTIKFDFLSNGFKVRGTQSNINASGSTYIYMAFAENPFGGDGAAPATAR